MPSFLILTIVCPDRMGIVATVSQFLFDHNCNIIDSAQFGDRGTGKFFLRMNFLSEKGIEVEDLRTDFATIASKFAMNVEFHNAQRKTRTLILVSKFGHCLVDLLHRHRIGALPIEVPMVVSNHRDYSDVAVAHGIPFRYLPMTDSNKRHQEETLLQIVEDDNIDLVVLARYMQVLSPELCDRLRGRIINIHHSFLPSFKGARPYHQAYARGVKLIGATAHYVTRDLDEGPIIEQAVERVSHSLSAEDFVSVGRDVESVVLARAVKWHAEHRILIDGNRTVVFN